LTQTKVVHEPRVLAADTLTGNEVVNLQNEDLGKIEHLMIDLERGRIAYAVLSFGGLVVNQFAAPKVVQNWPTHQINRLLTRVVKSVFVRATHNELRGG
jgi:hypothetical protein